MRAWSGLWRILKGHVYKVWVLLLILVLHTPLDECVWTKYPEWNTTCPDPCVCELRPLAQPEHTANCAEQKLRTIPMDLPINTQTLLLQGNAIRSLHDHLPQFTELKEMDLANNRITSLGPYAIFQNLTSLRRLNLEHNGLEVLLHGSFSGLAELEQLMLGHNLISLMEDHAFGGLNNLNTLSLEDNKLTSIQPKWFDNLPSLTNLSLADNQLEKLEGQVFKGLVGLEVLSLSGNKLTSLSAPPLAGLTHLVQLDLSNNLMTRVAVEALRTLPALTKLTLDNNPIPLMSKWAVNRLSIRELSFCRMPRLLAVDAGAFYNLPQLEVLQLHDNPKLAFMDPGALVDTPNVAVLGLQNNILQAVPHTLPSLLPHLREVSLYDNPLLCDCNVHWLKKVMQSNFTYNHTAITLPRSDTLLCHSPLELKGQLLKDLPLSKFPAECAPTVIAYFKDSYQIELGESLTYDCRAVGIPAPHIHWILPTGKIVNGSSNFSRVRLDNMVRLSVGNVKASDAGKYTCVATNLGGQGEDVATSVLKVHNKNIHVIQKGVATNFITVTWNGTGSTIATSDYVLMYRQRGLKEDYHKIDLRPYMRTYTITNLKPHTLYEFCMAYKHDGLVQRLNCINIQTKHQMFAMTGIRSMGSLSVLIAIVITCSFICFLCAATMIIRRYRKRKPYKQSEGVNVPERVGNLSQIPLDNIYQPPSTPLCTSRTSLIGQSSSSA